MKGFCIYGPDFIGYVQCSGGVGQKFNFKSEMDRLPGGRVAAHVGHVSADCQSVDLIGSEPFFQRRAGKAAWEVFLDNKIMGLLRYFLFNFCPKGLNGEYRCFRIGDDMLDQDYLNTSGI